MLKIEIYDSSESFQRNATFNKLDPFPRVVVYDSGIPQIVNGTVGEEMSLEASYNTNNYLVYTHIHVKFKVNSDVWNFYPKASWRSKGQLFTKKSSRVKLIKKR